MRLDALRSKLRQNGRRLDRLAKALPTAAERLEAYRADPTLLMHDAGFTPDPWQERLLRSDARQVMILCARQVGKSLSVSMLALKTALADSGSTTTIVAPVEEQANELLRKVTIAYHTIRPGVGLIREAVTRLEFANGSRILTLPGKESRMRSYSSALLIIDEAARVGDEVVNAAAPTLAVSGGRMVSLSTAFAKSGWFYNRWTDPEEDAQRLSITARDCPRISPEFLESERRKLGQRWFEMEYLNVFGDDIAAVFSSEDIARAVSGEVAPLFAIGGRS
jgi:Terminase large subunit, T4likevirus-type, N-terminal